jgi:hypothetical protein
VHAIKVDEIRDEVGLDSPTEKILESACKEEVLVSQDASKSISRRRTYSSASSSLMSL